MRPLQRMSQGSWVQTGTDMLNPQTIVNSSCQHTNACGGPSGLALITIGNTLRGDDGIGSVLCNALPGPAVKDVCRFDLGSYTGLIGTCLAGHKAAIIIDSTQNGTAAGTVCLMDLRALMDRASVMNVGSSHGLSLADELRIARQSGSLPQRIIFFGVEVDEVDWTDKLSTTLEAKVPQLVKNLSFLVNTVLETLKRNA